LVVRGLGGGVGVWFCCGLFFFFNDTATTEIYTLSLHDALPICAGDAVQVLELGQARAGVAFRTGRALRAW